MSTKKLTLQTLRIYFLFAIGLLINQKNVFSQDNSCAFHDPGGKSSIAAGFQGIKFFDENLGCNPLTLKCNFVIIRRDDGTGNLDPSSPFWGEWEQQMNNELANITDVAMCSTGYPLDSKVRVQFEVHTINNTSAWDWYAEANADNFPSTSSPNGSYICPRFDNSWSGLENAITAFEQSRFGEINFFFTDNGELVGILEDHLANNTEPNEPYIDRFSAAGNGLASGCSIFPQSYFSQASENSYVIAHTYSDYLIRNNFHHIWWPQYANESAATVWSWSYGGKKLLFLHEMGHNVLSMYHDNSCRQLMTTSWSQRTNHITKTQLEKLHRNLATTDLHNAVDCSNLDDVCPVQVVSNETLDKPMSVFGDLIIKSGVTFTVKSSIFFSEKSKVIVEEDAKFIVDGGLLTSGCGSTWKGIKVYGGNSDFDVKFTNGPTIENTSQAAVSMFAPEPWPQITNWGNGILQADNTTFNNTRRIVEMMAWKPSFNTSYIRDCVQNGGKWSITNWNCIGVEVKDNVFNNISDNCIVTETGQFLIEGNEFHSVNNDILFANVSPGFGTLIRQNDFHGASTGIRSIGTTIAQNKIEENQFLTGEFDIFMDGVNSYEIRDNDITSDFGAISIDNGIHSNDVFDNRLTGNFIGLAPLGSNQDYTFYRNCFTTSFADSYIDGQIAGIVSAGTEGAANNCFTHHGNANNIVFDITGNPSPFDYVEPNNTIPNCLNAVKAHPNITRLPLFPALATTPCGTSGTGDPIPPQYNPCNPFRTIAETTAAINWLNAKIIEVQNNPNLSYWQKKWFIAMYKRCLQRVTWMKYELLLAEGLYSDARALLAFDSRDEAKTAIYASYIYENDLQGASNYLDNMVQNSEALEDFKTIQRIQLNRLPYGPYYQARTGELSTVMAIAQKTHPYAGYAKALYYHLTGELLQSDLPEIFDTHSTPRSSNKKEITTSIYPNPFTNQFTVRYNEEKEGQITVSDLLGKTIYSSTISSDMIVSANGWQEGMYIVTIQSGRVVLVQEKIILIH